MERSIVTGGLEVRLDDGISYPPLINNLKSEMFELDILYKQFPAVALKIVKLITLRKGK